MSNSISMPKEFWLMVARLANIGMEVLRQDAAHAYAMSRSRGFPNDIQRLACDDCDDAWRALNRFNQELCDIKALTHEKDKGNV